MTSAAEDTNRRMLRARDAMDRCYAEPLDVPTLARIAHVSEAHFIRTASSYALAFPDQPMQWKCAQQRSAAMLVLGMAQHGVTEEAFWQLHPLPEHWSDAIKAEVSALVNAAYSWTGGSWDFCDRVFKDCMKAR